jgi:hypothetical protein
VATFTLACLPTFPEGTSVGAYPASGRFEDSGAPVEAATDSQTVSGGSVTFTGLTNGARYVAAAAISSVWYYRYFTVAPAMMPLAPPYGGLNGGTNTTPVSGTVWVTSFRINRLLLPRTLTGVTYRIGTVGGTDKVIAAIYDLLGNVVANSDLAGVTVGTAATAQSVPFTAPYRAEADAYFVSLSFNGTTARFQTVPTGNTSGLLATSATGTFGTLAAITPPTTFTADKAPVLTVY